MRRYRKQILIGGVLSIFAGPKEGWGKGVASLYAGFFLFLFLEWSLGALVAGEGNGELGLKASGVAGIMEGLWEANH